MFILNKCPEGIAQLGAHGGSNAHVAAPAAEADVLLQMRTYQETSLVHNVAA